jgi:hypothetical protein
MLTKIRCAITAVACAFVLLPGSASAADEAKKWYHVYPPLTGLPSCYWQCDPYDGFCETDPNCTCNCLR